MVLNYFYPIWFQSVVLQEWWGLGDGSSGKGACCEDRKARVWISNTVKKIGMAVHTCNLSLIEGGGRRIVVTCCPPAYSKFSKRMYVMEIK